MARCAKIELRRVLELELEQTNDDSTIFYNYNDKLMQVRSTVIMIYSTLL